ncbi:cytochrome c6, chloroplastic-like isoform X2 [Zingiber officinale]|uniref:cytochrome c6, chloroplastic-like isoform X2 n=1 Tax=Zingiber officinale TaxID=94328 RepID=UPI001C4BEA36|nr:cytochrome c6, chloroplastic-like isoform X2 [Zingiber officinale]
MQPFCSVFTCSSTSCCFFRSKMEETPLCQRQERQKKLPPGGGRSSGDDGGGGAVEGLVAAAVTLVLSTSCLASAPAYSLSMSNGAALFQKACIGCHDMGGNILQPGATLFLKDLQRNGFDTEESLYNITYYGKGRMPGFGEQCTPRGQCTFGPRLQEDEIKLLAEFVKLQADGGWPKLEIFGD